MLIKMLSNHKTYQAGETYEIDDATGSKWIDAEIAEKVNAESAIEKEIGKLKAAFEEQQVALVSEVSKAVKASNKPVSITVKENDDRHFGEWFKAALNGDREVLSKYYTGQKTAQNEGTGSAGGYFVPEYWANQMIAVKNEDAIVRPRATVFPMASNILHVPALDQTTNLRGGIVCYYVDEVNSGITETNFAARTVELHTKDLCGLLYVTWDMLNDSMFNLNEFISNQFRLAVLSREDKEYLVGNGSPGPIGVLNSGAALHPLRNTSNEIKFEDIVAMESNFTPESWDRAVWVVHQSARGEIAYLKDSYGRPIYLDNAQEGGFPALRGRPVLFTGKTSALGSNGDIMLCDFSYYGVGLRQDVMISFSEHIRFHQNQIAFKVMLRHDGLPLLNAPVTLDDGSTTVSPFVYLDASTS